MSGPLARRGFLRGLASLPLIGGSVALVGEPIASAEPVTDRLLWSYKEWLHYEHRMTCFELADHNLGIARDVERLAATDFHDWHFQWCRPGSRGPAGWIDAPQPSDRAALVLSAVDCDWRRSI